MEIIKGEVERFPVLIDSESFNFTRTQEPGSEDEACKFREAWTAPVDLPLQLKSQKGFC